MYPCTKTGPRARLRASRPHHPVVLVVALALSAFATAEASARELVGRIAFGAAVPSSVAVADLSIANSDGVATVNAGGSLTYAITLTNPGNAATNSVAVADSFPSALTCTWTCAASSGGSCAASGSGNITQNVNVGANGTVTFTASCGVSTSAAGSLVNTASMSYANDPDTDNNTATDTDTVVPRADLSITKTDGQTSANAGNPVTYTITVTNPSSNAVANVGVSDTFVATLSGCTWSCTASAGGSCQNANGGGNISTASNGIAGNGGTLVFSATCTLHAASIGTLINTATVSYANDPVSGNNSATDSEPIVPQSNLSITNSNGVSSVTAGAAVPAYTIVVTNPAGVVASKVGVTDAFPAALSGCSWTCSASSGSTCQTAASSG